ncbi:glycine cleavage system protein H [Thermithiobacillus tepidarius DSM 3134]|uniref:glycine cleavage system protein H n=1 Tax=Thermithiobacillus tepidarius TaxID=929 RepID=UPI0004244477|nr:glycine cleavage system protein H [Thermithiobacillus tepidarius]
MAEYRGCELPDDLFFDLDYVWIRPEEDGTVTLGITDPAQTMAGRVQKIRIKKVGTVLAAGRHVATLESGKWAGGVPCPFAGTVVAVNEAVLEMPNLVNIDPYHDAWIAKVRPDDPEHAFDTLATGAAAVEALQKWIDRYDVQCMRCAE